MATSRVDPEALPVIAAPTERKLDDLYHREGGSGRMTRSFTAPSFQS
jgi:hypothetical protein